MSKVIDISKLAHEQRVKKDIEQIKKNKEKQVNDVTFGILQWKQRTLNFAKTYYDDLLHENGYDSDGNQIKNNENKIKNEEYADIADDLED